MAFIGTKYRLASNWNEHLSHHVFSKRPINYLEIGTFYGANIISVCELHGSHPDSRIYCIDPWSEDPTIYNAFMTNIENSGHRDKIIVNRGYSNTEIPKFDDDFFDIIYIDGNHEPESALEDAVLSFRKLKKGGIMIFDDYGWGGPDLTQAGIDSFVRGFHKRIRVLGMKESQVFVEKLY